MPPLSFPLSLSPSLLLGLFAPPLILQIFLTYTPSVQEVFSNANIDGQLWGIILACSLALFFAIDLEKTFAPKYLMPIIRQVRTHVAMAFIVDGCVALVQLATTRYDSFNGFLCKDQ